MKTQVEFRSSKFPPYEGEEEQINPGLSDICGEDSSQWLCLAIEMVRARLRCLVEMGDRVVDSDGGDFQFEAYFPER